MIDPHLEIKTNVPHLEVRTNGKIGIPWTLIGLIATLLIQIGASWVEMAQVQREVAAARDTLSVIRTHQILNEVNLHQVCVLTHSPCKESP